MFIVRVDRAASEKPASGVPSPGVPARLDTSVAAIDEASVRTSTGTEAELARQLGLVTPQNDQSLLAGPPAITINNFAPSDNAPPPASDSEATEPEDSIFGAIIKHRVNHVDRTVRIRVQWPNGTIGPWMDERDVQEKSPELLYGY